jgi:BirA family biotin operon repressor/biotin-[acetyl-CoA-carboxylase] ligase
VIQSTKAKLLNILRNEAGKPVSGGKLARDLGISRVAVWKNIQSLINAGYLIDTTDSGYSLDPEKQNDFLYPWEFGENEPLFRHYKTTGSTMDRVRELAVQGQASGTVVVAEKQNAGRGRCNRNWASRQGGLYFSVLYRPASATTAANASAIAVANAVAIADYCLPVMLYQIAVARVLSLMCGKPSRLRWPNDIYIGKRKIAGLLSEVAGEGDSISWLAIGVGINVNNPVPSDKAVNCAEITGNPFSRREILLSIFNEVERMKKQTSSGMAYAQGNRLLAAEWNSMADCIGAKAAVMDSGKDGIAGGAKSRLLARGIFSGIDPAGRCIIKSEDGKDAWYFNPGPASVVFIN